MTTPFIPDFIFNMFKQEVSSIIDQALHIVANDHKLDLNKLKNRVKECLDLNIELVDDSKEKIKIIRTKPRKVPEDEDRCQARVNHKEKGLVQCAFKHTEGCDFCKRHANKELKFGTISAPIDNLSKNDLIASRKIKKIY